METNAYAAGEALDPEMMEETESTTLTDLLTSKAPEQRVQYFRRIFHKTEQPIQDIDTPLLCQTYPDFTNDICEAYLQYRTFTARVWANYDGACKQFFTDGRAVNCGKLVSNRKEEEQIDMLKSENIEMTRVMLGVGTAFRVLCQIVLRASPASGEVKAMCKPQTGDHPLLMKFLHDVCVQFNGIALPKGQAGFRIENIEQIANELLRKPDNKTYFNYQTRWRVTDEWMSSGRGFPTNPGYMPHLK